MTTGTLTSTDQPAFAFLGAGHRPRKPRGRGVTEMRGPYYPHGSEVSRVVTYPER